MQPIWWHHCTSSMVIYAAKISACKWFPFGNELVDKYTLVLHTPILATIKTLAMVRFTGIQTNSPQEFYGGAAKQMSAGPSPVFLPLLLILVKQRSIHPETLIGWFLLLVSTPFFAWMDSVLLSVKFPLNLLQIRLQRPIWIHPFWSQLVRSFCWWEFLHLLGCVQLFPDSHSVLYAATNLNPSIRGLIRFFFGAQGHILGNWLIKVRAQLLFFWGGGLVRCHDKSTQGVSMEITNEVLQSMKIGLTFQGYESLCSSPKLHTGIACWN